MYKFGVCLAAAVMVCAAADRRQELADLEKILPPPAGARQMTGRIDAQDKTWEDWQRRTGELPPDFDAMPSVAGLPEIPLRTGEAWQKERQRIRGLFEQWVYGKMPPAPDNLVAEVTGTRQEGGVTVRDVLLRFGPGRRATLHVQLMIPPGSGPFPVFLTNQPRSHGWVAPAVRRGYIGAVYYATDPIYGNGDDSDAYIEIYPDYDFSCLARWAWAGMRAVDYLYTLPEVDKGKIAISGHSRNGKSSLLAAAFDDRIAAVIPSSGNTGEGDPWRYTSDMFVDESLEQITGSFPYWFHPRLRFFAGREDKLPVDENQLLALVAPRGLFLYSAFSETEGNPFGYEQAYRSVLKVYQHLGAADKLWLNLRDGEHWTTAGDIEVFLDFLDTVFGRKQFPKREVFINGYTFEDWKRTSGDLIDPMRFPVRKPGDFNQGDWDSKKAAIRKNIDWALGEAPPWVPFPAVDKTASAIHVGNGAADTSNGWLEMLFQRPLKSSGMTYSPLAFGDDLKGDLYYPDHVPAGQKLPVAIWLHPFAYTTGYSRNSGPPIASLVRRGFAVLAFDQIGFGTRVRDAREFYLRYPNWSLMGKMVADTRAAIDAATSLTMVDPQRVSIVGYALGGKVGLLTAALDDRVKALAVVAAFDPLRLDTKDKGVEGVLQYSNLHGLIPRLGFFAGHEDRLPVDFDAVLAMVAPRPVLVVAPALDRYARVDDVRAEVGQAQRVYERMGKAENLKLDTPLEISRFTRPMQEQVFDWLAGLK